MQKKKIPPPIPADLMRPPVLRRKGPPRVLDVRRKSEACVPRELFSKIPQHN